MRLHELSSYFKIEDKKGLTEGKKGGILVYVLTAADKQAVTVRDFWKKISKEVVDKRDAT